MRGFWRRLTHLRRHNELARRLREELDFHTDMKASESGRPVNVARRDVGNSARIMEQAHDVWSMPALEHIALDFRYAWRALAKSPAFFLLAALGTTLGVAALTTVLSVASTALFHAVPYRDADRLVVVSDQLLNLGFPRFPATIANYLDYRAQNRVFEDVAAFESRAMTVATSERAERISGMMVSSNLLSLLGGSMEQGRWISSDSNHGGHDRAVVLGYDFWRSRFGGDAGVIGKRILIDDVSCTVIGVLKQGFRFRLSGEAPQVWLPANLDSDPARLVGNFRLIARLTRGVSPEAAGAQMRVVATVLRQRYRTGMGPHGEDGGYGIAVVPLREELYGTARPTIYALAIASGILLLLGLTNTAVLWLGRASARRQEAGVRMALGASRWRVGQQLVIEALMPALTGGALALVLTLVALRGLQTAHLSEFSIIDQFSVDYRVFGFTMLLSAGVGVLSGTLPLRSLFRREALAQERAGISGHGEARTRRFLIAIQVGLACALLPPTVLLVESLLALERVDPGFRTANVSTALVTIPGSKYRTPVQIAGYYQRLESDLRARLGGEKVTLASQLPLSFGAGGDPFSIEGRAFRASGPVPQFAHQIQVGDGYFLLLRSPILAGRVFDERDFSSSTDVAIVNETLARGFWPNESAVGKRILIGAPRPGAKWMEIVGIVGDVHTTQLSQAPLPQIYRPFPQAPTRTMALVVAGGGGIDADLEHIVRSIDSNVPLYQMKSMEQVVATSLDRPRFRTQLFSAYGLLAFALATFGVYSLSIYSGIRRRREFALRTALGATTLGLVGMMLADTMRSACIGAVVGFAVAFSIARALGAFLYGAKPSDFAAYAIAGVMALSVAGVAGFLGSRPLMKIDPAVVLRGE